jgi:hypothetical protein
VVKKKSLYIACWLACHPKHEDMTICTLCSKNFDVSNMGEAALKSHATFEDP